MDDLLAEFVAEARDMMEALSGEIVAWENDPGDKARLDAIFRFVHTVKGNCGFFDFPRLERLSHAAEDALADCRAGRRKADKALVTAVLAKTTTPSSPRLPKVPRRASAALAPPRRENRTAPAARPPHRAPSACRSTCSTA